MPLPSSPTRSHRRPTNSTSEDALERLPSLSFSRWNWIALTEPSGAKARHEETGQPVIGLRQHQERVAHRRRHEPFMPGDAIGVAVALRARHVGADVGAALLLGHAHAQRHAALCPPWRKGRVVGARRDHRHRLRQQVRLRRQRRDRGARHGDRAEMTGLDLRCHIEFRGAHHFGSAAGRLALRGPGRIVDRRHARCAPSARDRPDETRPRRAGCRAHRRSAALGVFSLARRPRSAIAAEPQCCPNSDKFLFRRCPAIGRDRVRQRPVEREQIDVFERRRLVEHFMGRG